MPDDTDQPTVIPREQVMLDPSTLTPHPKNPRRGDLGVIIRSMEVNGFYGVVIVQKSTGFVIKGNHTAKAAATLGYPEIPVDILDVDDARAERILLGDNRASDVAGYDDPALAELLSELQAADNLAGTGFGTDDVDSLLASMNTEAPARRDAVSPAEREQQFRSSTARQIVLTYDVEDFDRLVRRLAEIREATGVETNSDAAAAVIDAWTPPQPPGA